MNTEIEKKVEDIIESLIKSYRSNFNLELQREHSISLSYPGGKIAYFKKRKFELLEQITEESMIGNAWVTNGCNYNNIDTIWIQKHTAILIDYMDEITALDQLQIFFKQFLKLLDYENIIKEIELKPINNELISFILKNESVIIKLFERYGSSFPSETKDLWKKRWINGNVSLPKINTDEFKIGNNKHLLLTILNEAFPFMNPTKKGEYIKTRWGLQSYSSEISKYIHNTLRDPKYKEHPEKENIRKILESEQN